MRTLVLTSGHTQIHRITQGHTEIHMFPPVRWFSSPAINTSERRAGHVKQAHRKRCVCFTFPYSPWSGSTGRGIKNPRAAQPALHKIPLCGEYCLIKNPRCSSRKTRACSHALDAHTPRKTNFLLISFLNQVFMFKKMYFLIQIYTKARRRRPYGDPGTTLPRVSTDYL